MNGKANRPGQQPTTPETPAVPLPVGRKVIQISSAIDSVGKYFIVALCSDGTLWQMDGLYEGEITWEQIPAPPAK